MDLGRDVTSQTVCMGPKTVNIIRNSRETKNRGETRYRSESVEDNNQVVEVITKKRRCHWVVRTSEQGLTGLIILTPITPYFQIRRES